jgi:hypothetical protein
MGSYATVASMEQSTSLLRRCAAAVATELVAGPTPGDASEVEAYVAERSWDFAATPGWSDSWEFAVNSGNVGDPGLDPAVITDGNILARVQQVLTEYPMAQAAASE